MSWRGVCTATPQQPDPTSIPGLRANRARPPPGPGTPRAASRGIMHGPHHSATTPQVAGHRIKSLEAAGGSAAARAQTVWARLQTSLPTSRTRSGLRRLHISPADCSCRKRHRVRGTIAISGSRPRDYPHRWILSRVRCIAWFGDGTSRPFDHILPMCTAQMQFLRSGRPFKITRRTLEAFLLANSLVPLTRALKSAAS